MGMATKARRWTLGELHELPDDDGNVYELIHGELFVTPAPGQRHDETVARLNELLMPFVLRHGLGRLYFPRSVIQLADSQVEPDLAVRRPPTEDSWQQAPLPILVVEVLSPGTRRLDLVEKRKLYLELDIPECWLIDAHAGHVQVVRPATPDRIVRDALVWQPRGAAEPLVIDVRELLT